MSDQYTPPRSGAAAAPHGDSTRTAINITTPRTPPPPGRPVRSEGGGFATGLLVAAVFAVIAMLAYAILGGVDDIDSAPVTTAPAETSADPIPDPGPADPVAPAPADPGAPATDVAPVQPADP